MNRKEIKIVKFINKYILTNENSIKDLSKYNASDFIKIDNTNYIRFFYYNSKLGVDHIFLQENKEKLSSYLFNQKGYLESSYTSNIEITFENDLVKEYIKKSPDLESGSELEEIRNIALSNYDKCKKETKKLISEWERKNKGFIGLIRKIFNLTNEPLELDEPTQKYIEFKNLVSTIVNKQLDLIA